MENQSEVQVMKDNLVRAEMDFKTIQQKKSDFTRDLLAVKLHIQDVQINISKIENSVQDVDKISKLEIFRKLIVNSTVLNWRKKVKISRSEQHLELIQLQE
jgi:hypothetical protein